MIKLISVITGLICACCTSMPFVSAKAETDARYCSDFSGGNLIGSQERNIYYAERIDDIYINPYKAPIFCADESNSCAVDAGGNAFIYYDRLYDDLVPNYTHKYILGVFNYGRQTDAVTSMFTDLHSRMGSTAQGTTVSGFLAGMRSYAASRNHNITLEKVTGGYNNTDIVYIKEQLKQEKVIAIFVNGFSLSPLSQPSKQEGHDYVLHTKYSGLHTMLIYGYADYNYFDGNGNHILRDTYFYVSTGYVGAERSLLNINMFCTVNDMYLIDIS